MLSLEVLQTPLISFLEVKRNKSGNRSFQEGLLVVNHVLQIVFDLQQLLNLAVSQQIAPLLQHANEFAVGVGEVTGCDLEILELIFVYRLLEDPLLLVQLLHHRLCEVFLESLSLTALMLLVIQLRVYVVKVVLIALLWDVKLDREITCCHCTDVPQRIIELGNILLVVD